MNQMQNKLSREIAHLIQQLHRLDVLATYHALEETSLP